MSGLKQEIFHPMLDRVKVGHKLHESFYLCDKSLHTKFYTFPSFKNDCGGWWWVLKVNFSDKLSTQA